MKSPSATVIPAICGSWLGLLATEPLGKTHPWAGVAITILCGWGFGLLGGILSLCHQIKEKNR